MYKDGEMLADGVIIEQRDSDWVSGVNSGIVYQELNPTGDWTPYISNSEVQNTHGLETNACVSYSATHCVELILNQMIADKLIDLEHIQFLHDNGYLLPNGLCDLSERFTAVMSATSHDGNSSGSVWDAIRLSGVVPESAWPDWTGDDFTWDKFYQEPPQSVKDIGKKFIEMFLVQYEQVINNNTNLHLDLTAHLKQSPIQIITWAWPNPVNGVYPSCGCNTCHATTLIKQDSSGYTDWDHYVPFIKKLAPDYCIAYAIKGVVTQKKSLSPLSQNDIDAGLQKVLLAPIPPFNPKFGVGYPGGRVEWALAHRRSIYGLYINLLNRIPTPIEVDDWYTRQNLSDINKIKNNIMNSQEYKNNH